jgi:hypothetical protein
VVAARAKARYLLLKPFDSGLPLGVKGEEVMSGLSTNNRPHHKAGLRLIKLRSKVKGKRADTQGWSTYKPGEGNNIQLVLDGHITIGRR